MANVSLTRRVVTLILHLHNNAAKTRERLNLQGIMKETKAKATEVAWIWTRKRKKR